MMASHHPPTVNPVVVVVVVGVMMFTILVVIGDTMTSYWLLSVWCATVTHKQKCSPSATTNMTCDRAAVRKC